MFYLDSAFHGTGPFRDVAPACTLAKAASADQSNKRSVQSIALEQINSSTVDTESFYKLLLRRTVVLGIGADEQNTTRYRIFKAVQIASQCARHDSLAWFKTVTNAWCTSYRMHEPRLLSCIFGCRDEPDELSHYLQCNILWSLIDVDFHGLIDSLIDGRLNYKHPSTTKVRIISCAYEVYHALKIGLRDLVISAQDSCRFGEMCRVASKLIAEKHAGEPSSPTDLDVPGAQRGSTFCPLNKTCFTPRPDASRISPFASSAHKVVQNGPRLPINSTPNTTFGPPFGVIKSIGQPNAFDHEHFSTPGCQIGQQNEALNSNFLPVASIFRPGGSILGPQACFSSDSEQSACSRDPICSTVSPPPILSPSLAHISSVMQVSVSSCPDDSAPTSPVRVSAAEPFEGMWSSPRSPDDAP